MEKQMRAERTRRAQIIDAEGTQAAPPFLQAEGRKGADINQAEGHQPSPHPPRLKAKPLHVWPMAQAEAEAIPKNRCMPLPTPKADPTQYLIAIKYIDTIEAVLKDGGAGSKTVFMPYEASGLMSSVGGLKELIERHLGLVSGD